MPTPVQTQPLAPSRPNTWPASQADANPGNPPIVSAMPAAPPYGPYQTAPPYGPLQAGPPRSPGGPLAGMSIDPGRLCAGAQILGRVGNDVVLTSDVLVAIEDLISGAKGKMPPEKYAEQRAAVVKEVTAGIEAFNAHYRDPDPAKAMSFSQRGLIMQLLRKQMDTKMLYQDFRANMPKDNKEALQQIEETVRKHFDEYQLKTLLKRENVDSLSDLENALQAKGSSLDREKKIFKEQVIASQWLQEKVKPEKDKAEEEVTHEEMLAWYNAHLKEFEQPAKARWEELMISFARHRNHDEAYAAMAALGNRVLAGATLADVAKSSSDGLTAKQGGQWDWTHKGSLASDTIDAAIFSQPVGQLSPKILESENGYHIIRVVERREMTRTSFLDAQKEIKEKIKKERLDRKVKDFMEEVRKKYPVWTVFDNLLKEAKKLDDDQYR